MREFKFKKKFEDKLNKLGVREKFINNIIDEDISDKALNREESWWGFIAAAFIWETSPEKHSFWSKIANKYESTNN